MAIIKRITRLFQADFHAVLDLVEEPEALLRQAVREMEAALARDEARLATQHGELRVLKSREADLQGSDQDIDKELDLCFAAGEDRLARALVRRQLENERTRQAMAARRQGLELTLAEQETILAENRRKLMALHEQLQVLVDAEDGGPTVGSGPQTPHDVRVQEDEVEVAFLREKHKRSAS